MVNKAILVGNLGNDPEIRTTNNKKEIANFSVATNDSWKDKGSVVNPNFENHGPLDL